MAIPEPSSWFLHCSWKCSGNVLLCMTLAARGPTGRPRPPLKAHQRVLAAAAISHGEHQDSKEVEEAKSYNQVIYPLPSRSRCFNIQHRNFFSVKLYHIHCEFINIFLRCRQLAGCFSCRPGRQAGFSRALPSPGQAMPAETDCAYLTIYHCYIRAHSRAVIHLLKLQVSVEELF